MMTRFPPILRLALAAALIAGLAAQAQAQPQPPAWAYPVNPPGFKPATDDGSVRRVSGSSAGYTLSQTRDRFMASNWHPSDYPPMPVIVAAGRRPEVYACGFCHRANGTGGPENANITGLSAQYIVDQMKLFQSGERRSAVPQRMPVMLKATLAKAITDEEIRTAADYFARIPQVFNVRVVETDTVPRTQVAGWLLVPDGQAGSEPIGGRIVEMPDDVEHFEIRDSRAQFTAYVPRGSVAKGAALAAGQPAGRTLACASCHGADLRGSGTAPPLAGRSPSYLMRQMFDFQAGLRGGAAGAAMKPVVAALDPDEMRDLAAYLASLRPASGPTAHSAGVAK